MPTKKARSGKRLHQGVKLEAKKPLKTPKGGSSHEPYLIIELQPVVVSGVTSNS